VKQDVSIGHVHLKVSDLARSEAFYRDVLGFKITMRYGDHITFLALDGLYHHHLALNAARTQGPPPPPEAPGLLHFAILFPSRDELRAAARHVISKGIEIYAANDHGNSIGLYLRDPDDMEVELTWDRDASQWPRDEDGAPIPSVTPLDVAGFLDSD
jgi:catechol 2,3-dioxygenase